MSLSIRMNATPICLLAIAFMAIGRAFGQTAVETSINTLPASSLASASELLRWKFRVGDVIQVQQHMVETFTDSNDQPHRNTHDYHYLWTITNVAPDGIATIDVKPTLIRIDLEFPPVAFDSERDDPTVETYKDLAFRPWIYQARSMANAAFTFKVNPEGGVESTWGALPHLDTIPVHRFMTGDMPPLPGRSVSPGKSWNVDVGISALGSNTTGRATYRFADTKVINGRHACRIEGKVRWQKAEGPLGSAILDPTVSVSHFDAEAGRFLDEELTSGGRLKTASGESGILQQRVSRRLRSVTTPSRESHKSAEYAFAFEGDMVHYMLIAGEQQETKAPSSVGSTMVLVFYHDWNDVNQNKVPDPTELSDLTSKFTEEEGIRFVVYTVGMQDADVRAEVSDSNGMTIAAVPVRIVRGPASLAVRHLTDMQAGIYFLEWYVNDKFLIRIPVQIHSSAVTSTLSQSKLPLDSSAG